VLIEAGALLMITGRWLVDPELFDRSVLEEGKRTAATRASRDLRSD
jgi:hypothetical protein